MGIIRYKEHRLPDAFLMLLLQNLKDNRLDEDRHRLEDRLILRENKRDSAGFVSEKELKRRIHEKRHAVDGSLNIIPYEPLPLLFAD